MHDTVSFTWDEFHELYRLVAEAMAQSGRSKRFQRSPMMRFFLLMLYLTSWFTARSITAALQLRKGTVPRIVATCLRPVAGALESLFTRSVGDVVCREFFPDFPHVFAVVDASPIFINRPSRHEEHYYSGKYMRHCVKVQSFVIPDGQCAHISRIDRGTTHDKSIFDPFEMATFLTYQDDRDRIQHKPIMGDWGTSGSPGRDPPQCYRTSARERDLTRELTCPSTEEAWVGSIPRSGRRS
jgi:hypothetical protein